jgi:dTDP-4-dehydrorhamnose reductase
MTGNSFVNKVLGWSRKSKNLKIVNDQISSPTWAKMLVEFTYLAIMNDHKNFPDLIKERHGIYHLTGNGYTSRYDWAKKIVTCDPKRTEQLVQTIEPVSSDEFPTPARRPLFSALDITKFVKTFNIQPPDWEESLQLAMAE